MLHGRVPSRHDRARKLRRQVADRLPRRGFLRLTTRKRSPPAAAHGRMIRFQYLGDMSAHTRIRHAVADRASRNSEMNARQLDPRPGHGEGATPRTRSRSTRGVDCTAFDADDHLTGRKGRRAKPKTVRENAAWCTPGLATSGAEATAMGACGREQIASHRGAPVNLVKPIRHTGRRHWSAEAGISARLTLPYFDQHGADQILCSMTPDRFSAPRVLADCDVIKIAPRPNDSATRLGAGEVDGSCRRQGRPRHLFATDVGGSALAPMDSRDVESHKGYAFR